MVPLSRMKLFMLFAVLLVCLFINYRLGSEGFDASRSVAGDVFIGVVIFCFLLLFFAFIVSNS